MKETFNTGQAVVFPLRWKLMAYFAVFMTLIVFIGLYINLGLKMSVTFFKGVLDEYKYLEGLDRRIAALKFKTESYLADPSANNLERCLAANAELRERLAQVADYVGGTEQYYRYLDLAKCLTNYVDLSEKTVHSRRAGTVEIAYAYNYQMSTAADLLSKYLTGFIHENVNRGSERYVRLTRQTKQIEYLSYSLAVVIGLLCIVFCINFAWGITRPLNQMVQNARQIGEGQFRVNAVLAENDDEIRVIADVFNQMSRNIYAMFKEIQQKVQLERELKEEKLHNLEMENLVRSAELQVLQSQVNPHFLYNTLNAISQVAILEEATETGDLIKAVARLLRYNLQSLKQPVTIQDEIAHLKEYIYIMGVRYGDRIECRIECQGNVGNWLIPCMTLQPLVENAYIHGIAPLMTARRGEIKIEIQPVNQVLQISITDNGAGITENRLAELRVSETTRQAAPTRKPDQSTGLGLTNIRQRLERFFDQKDLMTIISRPGEGTRIVLALPMLEEVKGNVQFNDCG